MNIANLVINKPLIDHLIISNYDKSLSNNTNEFCLGIDEAGRGPVLGPMVYSAFFCLIQKENKLKEMKCADSKVLSKKEREEIFKQINSENDLCGYAVKVLSPYTISNNMLKKTKYNLNEISHDSAISLIDTLLNHEKLNITSVYLDTVGDPNKYELMLKNKFQRLNIKVSKKADSLYPCVSASSICAKVIRDYIIENWNFSENIPKISYDPETKQFLEKSLDNIFGFVNLVRFSWSTIIQKLNSKCVEVKWNDHLVFGDNLENEDSSKNNKIKKNVKAKSENLNKDKNNLSILNFFQKSQKRTIAAVDINYFLTDRNLNFLKDFY